MLQIVNDEVFRQFKKVYKEGEIAKGKNLLAFEVAKRNVVNFLLLEKKLLQNGDLVFLVGLLACSKGKESVERRISKN